MVEGLTACDAAYDAVLVELRDAKIESQALQADLTAQAAKAAEQEALVATLKQNMKDVRGQLEGTRAKMAQAEEAAKATIARLEADLAAAVREAQDAAAEHEGLQDTLAAVSHEVQVNTHFCCAWKGASRAEPRAGDTHAHRSSRLPIAGGPRRCVVQGRVVDGDLAPAPERHRDEE